MKVPVGWLKEYVDFDITPQELAEKLTFSGVEVEGIASFGLDYEGIVVGEVISITAHPNADRRRLCRVSNGKDELPVVCGADNVEVGDKVALQGNLDPATLRESPEVIRQGVADTLASYGKGPGHVFNLGHGITPDIDPDHLGALVDAVHELSPKYHP